MPTFLRPKGIALRAKVPHSIMNVVFWRSLREIWIWLYLEKPSIKDITSNPIILSMI